MKLLAMTVFCVDRYCTDRGGEKERLFAGGNSLNFAMQAKKSGVDDVSVLEAVGNDEFGKKLLGYLGRYFDTSHLAVKKGRTASNRIYVRGGERCFEPDSWDGGVFSGRGAAFRHARRSRGGGAGPFTFRRHA